MIVGHALARLESLLEIAPAHTLHDLLPRKVEILVKGVVVPVRGLGGYMTGLASHALIPRTVRGLVDEGTLAVTRHAPLLPVCSHGSPSLRIATGPVEFARALGVTVRGHNGCACVHLAVARPGVIGRGHTCPAIGCVTVNGHVTARPFLLTVRGLGKGIGGLGGVAGITQRQLLPTGIAAILGRRWSLPLQLQVAPFLDSCPLCRTMPGCSSACQGPWCSGMRS